MEVGEVRDELKTTAELLAELEALRQHLADLEPPEADHKQGRKTVLESEEHYQAAEKRCLCETVR